MAEKRSAVWKHFSIVEYGEKKKAKCNLCHSEVSYSGGSTGTMSNHLKHVHKSLNVDAASTQSKLSQSRITDFKKAPAVNMPKPKWQKITEKLAQMCARQRTGNYWFYSYLEFVRPIYFAKNKKKLVRKLPVLVKFLN